MSEGLTRAASGGMQDADRERGRDAWIRVTPSMRTGRTVVDDGRWRRSEDYSSRMRSMPDDALAALCCCIAALTRADAPCMRPGDRGYCARRLGVLMTIERQLPLGESR